MWTHTNMTITIIYDVIEIKFKNDFDLYCETYTGTIKIHKNSDYSN